VQLIGNETNSLPSIFGAVAGTTVDIFS